MKVGETVFIPDGSSAGRHLWVVIADSEDGSVAMVEFTGYVEGRQDHSCVVEVGEHPFITKKTVVSYGLGRILTFNDQRSTVNGMKQDRPADKVLLDKIRKQLFASDDSSELMCEFVDAYQKRIQATQQKDEQT